MNPMVNVSESGISLISHFVNSVEAEIPMTSLESILPLLKLLPALVLEQSTYHLRGAVSKPDFQAFSANARRVGEFTLSSHCDRSSDGFNIAPGTFVRLGQLQNRDSPGPLLPALTRLRLINPEESSMSQLPLFLTPSLRSVDVMNIPENQQSVLLSFLITLVDEAPHLATITFGPGVFTTACLVACSNFKRLRHLELKEVNISIDFNLVTAIGSLPSLETLVLHDQIGCYERDEDPVRSVGFIFLKKLYVTGTLGLIRLLYKAASLANLEDLELTLVRPAPPPWIKGKKQSKRTCAPDVTAVDLITWDFCDLLQERPWRQTLKSIRLNQIRDYDDFDSWGSRIPLPKPFDLPVTISDLLLEHTNLEDLEIAGWTLPKTASGDKSLFGDTSKKFPNLKTIRLPLGSNTSTIRLIELPSIAESHPNLVFLQCGIESLSNFTSPPLSTEMPSHGLKILSVGSSPEAANANPWSQIFSAGTLPEAANAIDWNQKLSIAAFLDTLFPNLERIETQVGVNSEQWECIYDLIKMCQTSRLIHANRHSVASQPAGDGK